MAINVNTLYLSCQMVANKQQQGNLAPDTFNRFMNMASEWLFNKYYGQPMEYDKRASAPQLGYAKTIQISEALAPFITRNDPLTLTSGTATKPSTLIHTISMTSLYTTNTVDVRRVEYDRLQNYLNSPVNAPSTEFPVYIETATGFEFYPTTISSVKISYLKKPTDGLWAYTVVSGRPVYNAGGSVNLEWDSIYLNELGMKILEFFGISVKDQQLFSNAVSEVQRGA